MEASPRRLYAAHSAEPSVDESVAPVGDDEAYRRGYEEGFSEGEADARRMADQRMRELEAAATQRFEEAQQAVERERQRLAGLADAMEHGLRQHATEIDATACELAVTGWQHAFGQAAEDRVLLQRVIQVLLDEHRAKALTVHISPEDRPLLPERIDGVELIEDNALRAGECRVNTAHGNVESSVQQRLRAISDAMVAATRGLQE
jgi:flagellar biosynthesis/type III secretory pathway protein FliH